MGLLTYVRGAGVALLAGITLAKSASEKENEDQNANGIHDTIDEEISELLFDNISITDGRYTYNVIDLSTRAWEQILEPGYVTQDDIKPRGEKVGKRVFEARAPDGATYLVFTRNGEITKHVVEWTREENKEILETLIKEKFHGKYRLDKITDADLEIYKTEIDSLVNNNGREIIESANAALDFGSFSLDALPHFTTIGENGGVDFLWQSGKAELYTLPYEGEFAKLRITLSPETEVIEMVANLAKDKEFSAILFKHFPMHRYFSLKEADIVRKDPDARKIIVQKGAELAKSYERNLGDAPTADDLETIVVLGKRDDMNFFDTLGTMMNIPEYDRVNFSRNINRLATFGSSEFLAYARDTLGLKKITTSSELIMLGEIAKDEGLELLHILHEQYGLKKITAPDLIALKAINENIGVDNLAYIAKTFDIPSLSISQLYKLAKIPKEAIDVLVANGEKPFKYAKENFGMQRLEVEELKAFSSFVKEEKYSKNALYSSKVKERFEEYKKTFGLNSAAGTSYGVYSSWHNLKTLVWFAQNDQAHSSVMEKAKAVYMKAKELGFLDTFEIGDIKEISLSDWPATEKVETFLERMAHETPIKKIPKMGIAEIGAIIRGGYEPQFFDLRKYITVPEVSFDEWVALTLHYDLVTTNGNASLFNKYGISHFERYDQGVLDRVADREIDTPKKLVVAMVYNKYDGNKAFENHIQRQMFQEIGAHNAVGLYETADDTGLFAALDDVGKEATIDLVVFGAHGSPVSMILGYNPCKDNIDEETGIVACGEESYYDLSDVSDLALRAKYFSPNAIVVLDACSTGAGGLSANNLANGTARALPGRTIVAANQPVEGFTITYDNGKPKEILADGFPFMTYAVRYVNGKLEQVDPTQL